MTDKKTRDLIAEARLAECSECSEEGTSPAMRCDGDLIRRLADALEALTVPDGDVRERLNGILGVEQDDRGNGAKRFAGRILHPAQATAIRDAILAAFPALSRAAAPEPEWEYGLRWNGEVVRSGSRETVDGYFEMWGGQIERRRKAGPWEPLPAGGETK